jgi:hypothetical protein
LVYLTTYITCMIYITGAMEKVIDWHFSKTSVCNHETLLLIKNIQIPVYQVDRVTKFCVLAPDICGSLVRNMFCVALLAPAILKCGFKNRSVNHHHHYHYHRVLLLIVEHRAAMKSSQALRSSPVPLTSFHDLSVFLISSYIFFRHVLFDLPLLLYSWGFQSNGIFSIAPAYLRNVCPCSVNAV